MGMNLYLRKYRKTDKEDIEEMLKEYKEAKSSMQGLSSLQRYEDFEPWYERILKEENREELPDDHVTASTYAVFDEKDKLIGQCQLRHELSDYLIRHGGHIAYSVRPSERRKGYATQIVRLLLEKAKERSLKRVLLTCDINNKGSYRVMEKCGGVFENITEFEGNLERRYWIEL